MATTFRSPLNSFYFPSILLPRSAKMKVRRERTSFFLRRTAQSFAPSQVAGVKYSVSDIRTKRPIFSTELLEFRGPLGP